MGCVTFRKFMPLIISSWNVNLSNAIVSASTFKEVRFDHCKMIGVRFDEIDPLFLDMQFKSCNLDYSSFYNLNVSKTVFDSCSLISVDFTDAFLTEASFLDC